MTGSRIHRAIYSIRWIRLGICQPKLDSVRLKSSLIATWPHFWNLIDKSTFTLKNIYLYNSVEFWLQSREQSLQELKLQPERKYFYFPQFSFAKTYKHQIHFEVHLGLHPSFPKLACYSLLLTAPISPSWSGTVFRSGWITFRGVT